MSEWNVITDLVHVSLSNHNDISWRLLFNKYSDSSRTNTRGEIIGYMDNKGKIVVCDSEKYKVTITDINVDYCASDMGGMIWFEKRTNQFKKN